MSTEKVPSEMTRAHSRGWRVSTLTYVPTTAEQESVRKNV